MLWDLNGVDPYEYYGELRRSRPVVWDTSVSAWLVADYKTCRWVLSHDDMFARPDRFLPGHEMARGDAKGNVMLRDGAEHKKLHATLLRVLNAEIEKTHRKESVRKLAMSLVEPVVARGGGDLSSEYADQLAARNSLDVLDLDQRYYSALIELKQLNDLWFDSLGKDDEISDIAGAAYRASRTIMEPIFRKQMTQDRGSLSYQLKEATADVVPDWDSHDSFALALSLIAGGEIRHTLRNAIVFLALNEESRLSFVALSAADKRAFVHELLRLFGPIHYMPRIARTDVDIGDVKVTKGDFVFPVLQSGNRDEARFPAAESIDWERKGLLTHLAFGAGSRYCIGAGLAVGVCVEALDVLLSEMPGMTLDCEKPPPRLRGVHVRSFAPIHIHV